MSTYHAKVLAKGQVKVFEAEADTRLDAYDHIHRDAVQHFGTRLVMIYELMSGPDPDGLNKLFRSIFPHLTEIPAQ